MSLFFELVYEAFQLIYAGFHVVLIDGLDCAKIALVRKHLSFDDFDVCHRQTLTYLISYICFGILVLADQSGRLSTWRLLDTCVA